MNLPEPKLPEHELIRAAADLPQLSEGLKGRVLRECAIQARRARWVRRLKVAGSCTVACGLLFLLLSQPPGPAGSSTTDSSAGETSHAASSRSRSSISSSPSLHDVGPPRVPDPTLPGDDARDMQQLNQMIEKLRDRERLLNCAFLPFL